MKLSEQLSKFTEGSARGYSSLVTGNVYAENWSYRGLPFVRERGLPLEYKGIKLDCGYRMDILVANRVVVEVKTVDALAPIHDAQLLTYLRLGGWNVGLLINFNVVVLKNGIHRRILG
jgi:GxxExxY protein